MDGLSNENNHVDTALVAGLKVRDQADISSLIEQYRHELHLHCYHLLGSLHDAEDAVQETLLRAWRHFATFRGQASLRTWLYTIATNTCLDMLKKRSAQTLPQAIFPAGDPAEPIPSYAAEALWLEPFPDTWLAEATENPEARYTRSESVSFAFLVALQLLPPRQRAILILADVLDWRAGEIARLLEVSVSAVNSALHRARATLAQRYHKDERAMLQVQRTDTETRTLLARYLRAWETDDVSGLVELLKEDAIFSMPPVPAWYQGRDAIRAVLLAAPFNAAESGRWRLYPTSANTQPAFATYLRNQASGSYQAFGLQVVTLSNGLISEVTTFHRSALVTSFGLPPAISA